MSSVRDSQDCSLEKFELNLPTFQQCRNEALDSERGGVSQGPGKSGVRPIVEIQEVN